MPIQVVGPIAYPNVKNLDQGTAEATLAASYFDFTYGASAYDPVVAQGAILTQSPNPDSTPTADPALVTVTLTVSLGAVAGALVTSPSGYRRLRRYLGDRP